MTCELYLIGQPENSGTEIHTIPAGSTAKLSFGATDIEGMQLDGNGGLVISTSDGSKIIIENYEAFACGEDQLTLADGTEIALDSLSTQFQTADTLFGGFEVQPPIDNIIDKPEANETTEVALTEGEKYICNFDPNALNQAMVEVADGSLILNFADGSQIVLANYSDLIDGELPPELTLADGTVIGSEELLTEVLDLEEALENIEPAAGDEEPTEAEMAEIAEQLADTETAAGGGPGGNSGYGFGSTVSNADFDAPDDIGALGATQLAYDAPEFTNQNYTELDSRPDLSIENEFLDETSLLLGPITREGQIDVNFGNDASGRVLLNGSTSTGGSLLDNTLSSNGVDVVITRDGNSYIGKAGDVTVFTFELETNGSYVFTQFETLDHGDANNDNDTLTINFGIRAVDGDGDSTNSSVAVTIADDAPIVLSQITPTLDETNFTADGLIHIGQFHADIGGDVNETGAYGTTGQFAIGGSVNGTDLTSNGVPITVTTTDSGYVGTANGTVIFTLNIDPDTGAYGYQQLGGIDHADILDANDMLTLHFGVDVTDFDGDSADGFISINILDDGPTANNDFSGAEEDQLISGNVLHNDDLSNDATNIVTTITYKGETYHVGSEFETEFGTFTIGEDGVWSYQTTAEDPDGNEDFIYTLQDADGDTDTATLSIRVTPDGEPVAVTGADLVDETNLDGGPVTTTGTLFVDAGQDGIGEINLNGNVTLGGSITELTHNGIPIELSEKADGSGYTARAGDTEIFDLTINDDATYTFTLFETIDHGDTLDPNDTATVSFEFGVTLTDPDGDSVDGSFTVDILDDGPVARDDHFKVMSGSSINPTDDNFDFHENIVAGHTTLYVQPFVNGATTNTNNLNQDQIDAIDERYQDAGASDDISVDDTLGFVLFDVLGNDTNGSSNALNLTNVTFANGSNTFSAAGVTYTVSIEDNQVRLSARGYDRDRTWNTVEIKYTAQDQNGNEYSATVTARQIDTNSPLVFDLDGDGVELLNLNSSVFFDSEVDGGTLDQTGWAAADDGLLAVDTDGDGRITDRTELFGDTEGFNDGFSKLAEYDSNNDGVITADDERYEDLLIWQDANSDGVSQEGELRTLSEVGISSIDVGNARETDYEINGQHIGFESTFTINGEERTVVDAFFDTIDGNDLVDANERETTDGASTSNTISASILHNDDLSQDDGNSITSVTIDGQVIAIEPNSSVTVNGDYGTLELFSDGRFNYTANNDIEQRSADVFTYTLTDSDGDSDTAELTLWVEASGTPPPPPSVNDTPEAVDDCHEVAASETSATGNVLTNDDFGQDGRGDGVVSFTVNGQTVAAGQSITTNLGVVTINADGSYVLDRPQGEVTSRVQTGTSIDHSTTVSFGSNSREGAARFNSGRDGSTIENNARDASGSVQEVTTFDVTSTVPGGTLNIGYTINDADGDTSSAILKLDIEAGTQTTQTSESRTIYFSSPLVLDLDGDGIELTDVNNGVVFDIDNDGSKEQTGWVAADDGLLTLDRNGDGVINDQSELFGNTDGADDGFARLSSFDSNEDGQITADDEVWSELNVWQDTNQDGVSDANELLSLDQIGIVSINLNAEQPEGLYIEGNWISHVSDFTFADGTTGEVVDAWFQNEEVFNYDGVENLTSFGQEINVVHDESTGVFQGIAGDETIFNIQITEDGSHNFNLFAPIDGVEDNVELTFNRGDHAVTVNVTQKDISETVKSGDQFLMSAIEESADSFAAMSQGDGATDLSMVIDQGDDVTETIQDFVYNGEDTETSEVVEIANANADDNAMFDMPANVMPALEDSSGTII